MIKISQLRARIDCLFRGHFWTEQKGKVVCDQCGAAPRKPIDLEVGF